MNWKFWQRKHEMKELSFAEINSRIRGFILDSQINNAHEIAVILGTSLTSPEVLEREEEESENRVNRISYVIPLVFAYSHALSEGAVEYQRASVKDTNPDMPEMPHEIWQDSRKLMEQVAVAALLGGIAQLVDMGLLEVPKIRKKK